MPKHSDPEASRRTFLSHGLSIGAGLVAGQALLSHAYAQSKDTAPAPAKKPAPGAAPAAAPAAPEGAAAAPSPPSLSLPALPYPEKALEPHISALTLSFHYGKHHKAYYDKTNALITGTPLAGKSLEEIIKAASKNPKLKKVYNNAAQAFNHTFYWQSMKPGGGGAPTGELKARIDQDFGSYDAFKSKLIETAVDRFSNGWVWLALHRKKLVIVDSHDAELPPKDMKPLAVADVWEHAYYLDYKNARKDYITRYADKLLNWDFVAKNLEPSAKS